MAVSTYFALLAEFNTGDIPLSECCKKYFGIELKKAAEQARQQKLPIPAYRGGSNKSMWLINAGDLALFIDERREQARRDWERLN